MATKAQAAKKKDHRGAAPSPQIKTLTHLTPNQIFLALKEKGMATYYDKIAKALAASGLPVIRIPSSAKGGLTTLYTADDAKAWMAEYAAKYESRPAVAKPELTADKSVIVELRALRRDVDVLKDAIHTLMTSVIEAREFSETMAGQMQDMAALAREQQGAIATTLDEIQGTLGAIQAAEKDEKVTLDNVLDILTQPASTGAPPDVGIDAILETHDDQHS